MTIRGIICLLLLVEGLSQSESKAVIGQNAVTCITFDLLDWKGDFIASRGVYLKNNGVRLKEGCGLDGDCGVFEAPSVLILPIFKNNMMFQFSMSLWFVRNQQWSGSFGGCDNTIMELISVDDNHLMWAFQDGSEGGHNETFETASQSTGWHHIVVSTNISRVSNLGRTHLYFDGEKIGSIPLDGTRGFPTEIDTGHIGGNDCVADDPKYFIGRMDSISFARYPVSSEEVRQLYDSRGQCIGE